MILAQPNPGLVALRPQKNRHVAFTLVEVLVVVAILVILAGIATVGFMKYMDDAKINTARMNAQNIHKACKAYYTQNDQNWPADLSVLADPTLGRSYLDKGQEALMDPWGKPYQMQQVQNANGEEELFIFTQSPQGQTIGWPRAYEQR
jgi:prepilin-type N-terminal cleavage/methylation domain-containing protein